MDINSSNIINFYKKNIDILNNLLLDRTTNKYLIFATENYLKKGFKATDYITPEVFLSYKNLIKPRIEKGKLEQKKRSKDMAEVFTPSWICNKQNNLIDNEWFGYVGSFNIENDKTWLKSDKVVFNDKSYMDYINDIRLEITCGEGPYLVSRYDTVSGEKIDLLSRVGFFDRKMRVIIENVESKEEFINCSLVALKSIYGYDFQGDNLFITRQNLFISYIEYYEYYLNELPSIQLLTTVSCIISYNIFQMDGLKFVIPFSCTTKITSRTNLFGETEEIRQVCEGCRTNDIYNHNGKYVKIKDWEKDKMIKFTSLLIK